MQLSLCVPCAGDCCEGRGAARADTDGKRDRLSDAFLMAREENGANHTVCPFSFRTSRAEE